MASSPRPFLRWHAAQEQRLDQACRQQLPHLSRRSLKLWLQQHPPTVEGRLARPGTRVQQGQLITLLDPGDYHDPLSHTHDQAEPNEPQPPTPPPQEQPYILLTHTSLLALHKPSGWPSHPLHPWEQHTASQWLVQHHPELLQLKTEARAPGLLHRLDNDTSGVLLFARTQEAYDAVLQTRRSQKWGKYYLALVWGHLQHARAVNQPIQHDPQDRRRMRLASQSQQTHHKTQQQASSFVVPLHHDPSSQTSLVAVQIETGVRHQIRVHLASLGHPIVGDPLYTPDDTTPHLPIRRLMLHAWMLQIPSLQGKGHSILIQSPPLHLETASSTIYTSRLRTLQNIAQRYIDTGTPFQREELLALSSLHHHHQPGA